MLVGGLLLWFFVLRGAKSDDDDAPPPTKTPAEVNGDAGTATTDAPKAEAADSPAVTFGESARKTEDLHAAAAAAHAKAAAASADQVPGTVLPRPATPMVPTPQTCLWCHLWAVSACLSLSAILTVSHMHVVCIDAAPKSGPVRTDSDLCPRIH